MIKYLEIALKASLEAGKTIMDIYDSEFNFEIKPDKSPLTEADTKASHIINEILSKTSVPIISEESKQINYEIRKYWDTCWLVDPLDGTKEFIKRNGEFTVNIALINEGKPIIGVIYAPVIKTIYFADVGSKKAFKSKINSQNVKCEDILKSSVRLSDNKQHTNNITVVGSRSHLNDETEKYINKLQSSGKTISNISKGSSLKFCLIAEGKADIYPRFAPTMEWDTAAGQAICNALGIDVISTNTNQPLVYNKEELLNPPFLVINSEGWI